MALDMKKFMARFVEESRDHLNRLNQGLVKLEKNPDDAETVNDVFRSAHTIKGSARLMKLTAISEVAHKLEDALAALRGGRIRQSSELTDTLLKSIDCIAGLVEQAATGKPPEADTRSLCEELSRAAAEKSGVQTNTGYEPSDWGGKQTVLTGQSPAGQVSQPAPGDPKAGVAETIRVDADKLDVLIRLMGEIVSTQNRLKHRLAEVKEAHHLARKNLELTAGLARVDSAATRLMPELFLTSHALNAKIGRLASEMRDDATMQELLTTELQEKALMLRMLPLSHVFDSLHRMVRDLAASQQKKVDFIVEGGEIGLDRKMMEKMSAPLVHMLRNAVDHGIESIEERRKAGKPEHGRVVLSAGCDAGSVVIELQDDGRGIALEKIRERALRKKIISEEELTAMTESELVDLIFQPGFSTSTLITDVSGRGVGMDVVRRNFVEELKGTITVDSKAGIGVCFTIRLPMTLSVMRVLLVNAGNRNLAVSTHYVAEIVRVPASNIITVLNRRAVRLREELIPVKALAELIGCENGSGRAKSDLLILITRMGNEKLGLIVDSLVDEEDIVIKSLPAHLSKLPLVAGVTISGKNEVISILNVPGIMAAAEASRETRRERPEPEPGSSLRILVVDDSVNTRDIEKNILEAYGYDVDLAADGIEAIEKARNSRYDLIVTDIEMPRMDGFSLTERLRGDDIYRNTPIIIVTSREKEEDKKRGILVGANAYIIKGAFDQTNLLETVQNLVG